MIISEFLLILTRERTAIVMPICMNFNKNNKIGRLNGVDEDNTRSNVKYFDKSCISTVLCGFKIFFNYNALY